MYKLIIHSSKRIHEYCMSKPCQDKTTNKNVLNACQCTKMLKENHFDLSFNIINSFSL